MAMSPHPHAYRHALGMVLLGRDVTRREVGAVAQFFRCVTDRLRGIRLGAAAWLEQRGDRTGFPVLLQERLSNKGSNVDRLLAWAPPALVAMPVRGRRGLGDRPEGAAGGDETERMTSQVHCCRETVRKGDDATVGPIRRTRRRQ